MCQDSRVAGTTQLATHEQIRAQFPALESGFAFFENAGGSLLPKQVIDRMTDLLTNAYVQIGAGYPASDAVTETADSAKAFANVLMNGEGVGTTVLGPSTTDLLYRLSNSMADHIEPGDEVVVSIANHESNISPWIRLEKAGAKVVWWDVDPESGDYSYEELKSLLGPRTKLVAVAHTSNLLGDIMDVQRVAEMAHAVGAQIVVDGVAFAAHGAVDVQAWDVDFYTVSMYKLYGPHIAGLFGTTEAWAELSGPNHYFIADDDLPWKWELGCQPYEALAGILGLGDYLAFVTGSDRPEVDRKVVEQAFRAMREFEVLIQAQLMEYLTGVDSIRLVGPRSASAGDRHPTICFLHDSLNSAEVVGKVNGPEIGIRCGHMYASRLCGRLGAPTDTGFVRISAVHYNSAEEVDRLIQSLHSVL